MIQVDRPSEGQTARVAGAISRLRSEAPKGSRISSAFWHDTPGTLASCVQQHGEGLYNRLRAWQETWEASEGGTSNRTGAGSPRIGLLPTFAELLMREAPTFGACLDPDVDFASRFIGGASGRFVVDTLTLCESYLTALGSVEGARKKGLQGSRLESHGSRAYELDWILQRGESEQFEQGMESELSRRISDLVLKHGLRLVEDLSPILIAEQNSSTVVAEILLALARVDEPASRSGRRELISRLLESTSPIVRDAAATALLLLGDRAALPQLRRAAEREVITGLRRDLFAVIDELSMHRQQG